MTWRELKKFISKIDKNLLDSDAKLYDYATGDEHLIDITELLISNNNEELENGWVPYLAINHEEADNENKTEETSVD